MAEVALVISLCIAALGGLGVASPDALLRVVGVFATPIGLYAAAAIRLVFGAALFFAAPTSRAPRTLRIVGVVVFVAGLLTPFIGLERLSELLDWWSGWGPGFLRAWGAVALAMGLLLAHAVFTRRRAA